MLSFVESQKEVVSGKRQTLEPEHVYCNPSRNLLEVCRQVTLCLGFLISKMGIIIELPRVVLESPSVDTCRAPQTLPGM